MGTYRSPSGRFATAWIMKSCASWSFLRELLISVVPSWCLREGRIEMSKAENAAGLGISIGARPLVPLLAQGGFGNHEIRRAPCHLQQVRQGGEQGLAPVLCSKISSKTESCDFLVVIASGVVKKANVLRELRAAGGKPAPGAASAGCRRHRPWVSEGQIVLLVCWGVEACTLRLGQGVAFVFVRLSGRRRTRQRPLCLFSVQVRLAKSLLLLRNCRTKPARRKEVHGRLTLSRWNSIF